MLILKPVIYLWLHRKWGEGKVIQGDLSWHLENYDRKGMKIKRGLLFLPVPWGHPPSHTQSGHLLNETIMKEDRARTGCRMSVRQDCLFAEDWLLACDHKAVLQDTCQAIKWSYGEREEPSNISSVIWAWCQSRELIVTGRLLGGTCIWYTTTLRPLSKE